MEKMIQAMAKKGLIDDAMKLVDNLVELDGDDGWYFLRLKGDVQAKPGSRMIRSRIISKSSNAWRKTTGWKKRNANASSNKCATL